MLRACGAAQPSSSSSRIFQPELVKSLGIRLGLRENDEDRLVVSFLRGATSAAQAWMVVDTESVEEGELTGVTAIEKLVRGHSDRTLSVAGSCLLAHGAYGTAESSSSSRVSQRKLVTSLDVRLSPRKRNEDLSMRGATSTVARMVAAALSVLLRLPCCRCCLCSRTACQ